MANTIRYTHKGRIWRHGKSALEISAFPDAVSLPSLRRQGLFKDTSTPYRNASGTMNAALSSQLFDMENLLQSLQPACTIQWPKASSAR